MNLSKELNNPQGICSALDMLSFITLIEGDIKKALLLMQECEKLVDSLQSKWMSAMNLIGMGRIYCILGNTHLAWQYLRNAVVVSGDIKSKQNLIIALTYVLYIIRTGSPYSETDLVRLTTITAIIETFLQETGFKLHAYDLAIYQRVASTFPDQEDEAGDKQGWATGQSMSLEEAVEYVLDWVPAWPEIEPNNPLSQPLE